MSRSVVLCTKEFTSFPGASIIVRRKIRPMAPMARRIVWR